MSYPLTHCIAGCGATFEHPNVEDCASVHGKCEHFVKAGWKPIWARLFLDDGDAVEKGEPWGKHLLSRGAWMCPACVKKHPGRPTKS